MKISLKFKNISKKHSVGNFFYSPKFRNYLMTTIFPYTPLMTKMLLKINGLSLNKDITNNIQESWNNVFKRNDLKGELPAKLGRFIKSEFNNIQGIYQT